MGKSIERNHPGTGEWGSLRVEGGTEASRNTIPSQRPQTKHKVMLRNLKPVYIVGNIRTSKT